MTGTRRLFVALCPPPAVVDRLARVGDPHEPPSDEPAGSNPSRRPAVRWVAPSAYHVTLRFLGEADPDATVAALDALLGDAAAPVAPVTVDLGPAIEELGSALVVPATGVDELAALVSEAVAGIGEEAPTRPFVGHLTLGRWRRGRTAPGVVGRPVTDRFVADAVDLLASEAPGPSAPSRYLPVRTWPLRHPTSARADGTDGG